MSQGQGIDHELSLGEVISKTFDLYRRDFAKYLVLFVVVEAIIGVADTLIRRAYVLPTLPSNPTPQQFLNWFPGFFAVLIPLLALTLIVTWVFYPVAVGGSIKMASGEIEKGETDLGASVRFAMSKLVWIWVLGIVIGIIVSVGFIALIVPGIILSIMFSLVLPALLIENTGVFESMGRSRTLVAHRWLKTFAVFLIFIAIVIVASLVVGAIGGLFGFASTIVSGVLAALYAPLIPIALTVYYYSNVARISPLQTTRAPMAPAAGVQPGMKFCPKCGAQLAASATFCSNCGAQQPA